MEHKHAKAYSNILKLIPKSSVVNFQNPLYSPGREKRSDHQKKKKKNKNKTHMGGKGFSGPVMSMSLVPRNSSSKNNNNNGSYREPTSPKISCMGQIKQHKKKCEKANSFSVPKEIFSPKKQKQQQQQQQGGAAKKHPSMFKRMFSMSSKGAGAGAAVPSRKSFDHHHHGDCRGSVLADRAPALSQMKRFASGRDSFASFDWNAHDDHQIAPQTDRGTYYTNYQQTGDCDDHRYEDEDEDEDDDEDFEDNQVIIPFSAPIAVVKGVALQPRKEVNLWKRRTMNPPAPLNL